MRKTLIILGVASVLVSIGFYILSKSQQSSYCKNGLHEIEARGSISKSIIGNCEVREKNFSYY